MARLTNSWNFSKAWRKKQGAWQCLGKARPNNGCDPMPQDGFGSAALIRPQNIAKAASAERVRRWQMGQDFQRGWASTVSVVFRTFVSAKALYFASGGVDEFVPHMKNFGSHFIFRRLG